MKSLGALRDRIRDAHLAGEGEVVRELIAEATLDDEMRHRAVQRATGLIKEIRQDGASGLLEVFLAEYSLSTDEGIALMCLAEALLRVEDTQTIDALIEDKITPSNWSEHLGHSSSPLVNASTWALMLTGKVQRDYDSEGLAGILRGAVKRVGEPVIRSAVKRAMKELGKQFVLGRTIKEAVRRGTAQQEEGYTFSYDMLGETALTARDAKSFFKSYKNAIETLKDQCQSNETRDNPGISIKLSALHPRYEVSQKTRVMAELVPLVRALTLAAKDARMGLNIDAEEANRLDVSLDVIEAVLGDAALAGWDGFGVVVQAYSKRARHVIDWLHALAEKLDRRIMVRLVKGAYWDTEIKRAQVDGIADFPVFSRKAATDISYICCARKLLGLPDRIYPQFATHNAHTISAILEMSTDGQDFEFQRLHGMGAALHKTVMQLEKCRCRVYAPVGAHRDLLAYLVRRLLENGANSSFVNQIVNTAVAAEDIAKDPIETFFADKKSSSIRVRKPNDLFAPERDNSRGWDLDNLGDLARIESARSAFKEHQWQAGVMAAGPSEGTGSGPVINPANPRDIVGCVSVAGEQDVEAALHAARMWSDCPAVERAAILLRASNLFEENFGEFVAILTREGGKTPLDAVAELREAVDFLRYYSAQCKTLGMAKPCGLMACISPWNFPLAIFTGQIAAALAAGNGVLAKPSELTPITASIAVGLLHDAGVPLSALQLLPGSGPVVGAKLTSDPRIHGICFTGSTATAQTINRAMAAGIEPHAPLIAETGGVNAMIVDSTALPEQAVTDIITSAFQSAGQRCSALRILYLQDDIVTPLLEMLFGAMDELAIGDPWEFSIDIGPVINEDAHNMIFNHVDAARRDGRLMKQLKAPETGFFIGPAVIRVDGIKDLKKEIFGPVLHVATYQAPQIDKIIDDINASGYGLTFGLHTRIDDRVESLTSRLNAGNMYINRNQIGAIVGSQPFGGEGLSGSGPKAGGPHYLKRFCKSSQQCHPVVQGPIPSLEDVQAAIEGTGRPARVRLETIDLPGPTGESNRMSLYPRGLVLCLGPSARDAGRQVRTAREIGCAALAVAPGVRGPEGLSGFLDRTQLSKLQGIDAVALWSDSADLKTVRQALASRDGPLIPLITTEDMADRCVLERHVCIDTTAAGGNASLLAANA